MPMIVSDTPPSGAVSFRGPDAEGHDHGDDGRFVGQGGGGGGGPAAAKSAASKTDQGKPAAKPRGDSWSPAPVNPVERKEVDGKLRPGAGAGAQLPPGTRDRLKALGVSKLPAAHIAEVHVSDRIGDDAAHQGALLRWKDDSGKEQRAYSKEFDRRNAEKKWVRVLENRPKVEEAIGDLREKAATSPAHAAALLIAETGLRPGSPESVEKHQHYGATTIEARHVKFDGNEAHLEFVGKAGKVNHATINDPALVSALRKNIEGKEPTAPVFGVRKEAVAAAAPKGVKLKDFRTIVATSHAEELLSQSAPSLTGDAKKDSRHVIGILKAVSESVSKRLNNTPAMARRSYIAPQVIQAWGKQHNVPPAWIGLPGSTTKPSTQSATQSVTHHPELLGVAIGRVVGFSANVGPNGRLRVGVWDRLATLGYKEKDGEPADFTPDTLHSFARNWYARSQRISVCLDHASVHAGLVPAPAAAWYDAMAVIVGARVVFFKKLSRSVADPPDVNELRRQAARFATDDHPSPSPDGLWWHRCVITPLGEHPTEGLRNYLGLSPMFRMDGRDEAGRPCGPVVFDGAAVNANFQAGCELTLGHLARSRALGAQMDPTQQGQPSIMSPEMKAEMMRRLGLADGCSPADKMAAYMRHAFDASPDELQAMASDMEAEPDEGMKKMGMKFRRMARMATMDVDPDNKEQNAVVHLKTGNVHDEEGRKTHGAAAEPEDEKQAKMEMARTFGVTGALTWHEALTHLQAKTAPAAELATLRAQVQTMGAQLVAVRDEKIADTASAYVAQQIADGRADAKATVALVQTFSRAAADAYGKAGATREAVAKAGADAIEPFLLVKGTLTLGQRLTAGGHPIGKPTMPVTSFAADTPEDVEGAVAKKAREAMSKDKTMTFGAATRAVLASDQVLAAQYRSLYAARR